MNMQRSDTTETIVDVDFGADCRYNPTIIPGIIAIFDFIAIVIPFYLVSVWYKNLSINPEKDMFIFFFCSALYMFLAYYAGLYRINAIMRPMRHSNDILISIITTFSFFMAIVVSLGVSNEYYILSVLIFCIGCIFTTGLTRAIAARVLKRLSARNVIGSTLVVLGTGEQGQRFLRRLREAKPFFVKVVGVFAPDDTTDRSLGPVMFEGVPVLGGLPALFEHARARKIDDVVVALPWNADRTVMTAVEKLKELPINVYLSADLVGFELAFEPAVGDFHQLPMFEVIRKPISGWGFVLKIAEDLILAMTILVLTAPLMLLIAVLIKLDSPGPVFFRQRRLGFNNREFPIYKFRSMRHDAAEAADVRQATKSDPRVTRVGRFIRATSLDELPQLLNVLNGSMSLVGPRPHALSHNAEYGRQIRGYFSRHRVKPGITGWAQVNGYRGETETLDKMERRISLDLYYAENWSLFFDLKILVMTAYVVLIRKNAY
jgi:Undecaprenyl-phosphate glucose phosphotransferase